MGESSVARKTIEDYERELRDSEARFQSIIGRSADSILIVNEDGIVRFANPVAETMFGQEAEALVGQDFGFPVVLGEKVEVDLIGRAGKLVTTDMRVTETQWEGEPCYLVSLRDITERKQAEEKAARLNAVLRAIRNVGQLMVREKDRHRLLQGVCDTLVEARGYYNAWIGLLDQNGDLLTVAEAGLGENFLPLLGRLKQGERSHCMERTLGQSGVLAIEHPHQTCIGCPLAESYGERGALSVRLEHRGEVYGVLTVSAPRGFVADEEEHALFGEMAGDLAFALRNMALERRREELEQIVNRSPAVAFLWRAEEGWPVEFVSDNVDQFGYRPSHFYAGRVKFVDMVHPDDRARVTEEVAQISASQVKQFTQEYRVISASSQVHWVDDRTWIRHDSDGGITHYEGIILDITERKRMEENLLLKDAAMATSINAIAMFDMGGVLTYANAAFLDLWGYQSMEELLTQSPTDFWRQPEQVVAAIQALGESGYWRGELVAQRRDGTFFHVQAAISRVTRNGGEPIAVMASFLDITERKRMEEALRESEERFRSVVEQSQDGIVLMDHQGRIVEWNQGQAQIMGLRRDEVLGRFAWDVQVQLAPAARKEEQPDLRAHLRHMITRYLGEEDAPWLAELSEREVRRPDGARRIVQSSIFPIVTQEGKMLGSITRDVTAQRSMEEALRHSEQRYRALFEHAGDGIFVHDLEGRFLDVNQIACERLGYSREELLHMTPMDIARPEDAAGTPGRIARLQVVKHIVFEATLVRRDGTPLPVEVSSRYVEYDDQPAILSIVRDVSERKQAEERIAHYAADLERSNRDLEQFGYVISHDLREPLRVVSSYLQLLVQRYGSDLDDRADTYIHYAVEGVERMRKMIKALLNLSRVETHGQAFEKTNAEDVLERTLRALGRVIKETGAQVTHDPLPVVMADPAQLGQVFQNLIANGIKFCQPGQTPRVHVSAEQEGDEWAFSVTDNGIGIDPQQADYIFEIFQRLHTEEEYPGLGMGLALCKRIVERHGGRMWVESQVGQGATFRFTLPRSIPPAPTR